MSMMIFSKNFTDPSIVANAYVSSANASFPVSNAYNLDRRRRTWRSAGYFNIIDGDNTLVFRETNAVDLTATITAGEYTSDILTAIKTALESAGASTYTVTRNANTNKITITSDGAGGGGIFELVLTDADSADMAAVLGFSTASDLTGALTYTADLIRIHTEEFLTWDLGIPTNPTGLIGTVDRNSPIGLSDSATLKLQGNLTNEWSSPQYDETVSISNGVIYHINSSGFYTGGLRYWRLSITESDNSSGYIELGAIALSEHVVTTRGCTVFPLRGDDQDRSSVVFSEGGRTVVTKRNKSKKFQLSWEGLDIASYEKLDDVFNSYGLHSSFFISMDPNQVYSTDTGKWIKLVKFDSDPSSSLVSPGNWSVGWTIREEL